MTNCSSSDLSGHFLFGYLTEHSGLITGVGADLQHLLVRGDLGGLGHMSDDEGL